MGDGRPEDLWPFSDGVRQVPGPSGGGRAGEWSSHGRTWLLKTEIGHSLTYPGRLLPRWRKLVFSAAGLFFPISGVFALEPWPYHAIRA
jgi:hypothetical protein